MMVTVGRDEACDKRLIIQEFLCCFPAYLWHSVLLSHRRRKMEINTGV